MCPTIYIHPRKVSIRQLCSWCVIWELHWSLAHTKSYIRFAVMADLTVRTLRLLTHGANCYLLLPSAFAHLARITAGIITAASAFEAKNGRH